LPSPYGDCEQSENYTETGCLAECEASYVISNCSCKDIAMPGNMTNLHHTVITALSRHVHGGQNISELSK